MTRTLDEASKKKADDNDKMTEVDDGASTSTAPTIIELENGLLLRVGRLSSTDSLYKFYFWL
jgi:hypothetical protein